MAFLGANTSQAERAVKALELEFPVSNIRTAVQVSLGALRSTEYARPIGSAQFSCQMDCNPTQIESSCCLGHVCASELFPVTRTNIWDTSSESVLAGPLGLPQEAILRPFLTKKCMKRGTGKGRMRVGQLRTSPVTGDNSSLVHRPRFRYQITS